jgi:N6-adenosine-specific RNA methylase IME4
MGNYWRVSHEFLLLGVRGNLPFPKSSMRSWHIARRSAHSRKPFLFRGLIEQVSPGPYLELYGREEHPNTDWTVYGNQVERRLVLKTAKRSHINPTTNSGCIER